MAASPLVIKFKYGTILKRISTPLVDKKLLLDLAMLKDKICRLFRLVSHADLTMTYVDEDGDEVCLDSDDEFSEAVRQNLNPLRITIKLNPNSRYSPYPNTFFGNTSGGGSLFEAALQVKSLANYNNPSKPSNIL